MCGRMACLFASLQRYENIKKQIAAERERKLAALPKAKKEQLMIDYHLAKSVKTKATKRNATPAQHARQVADYEKAMAEWKAKMTASGHGDIIDKLVTKPAKKAAAASTSAKRSKS
ncbi:unnamed protein product [Sphagnum balticum]